MTPTAAITATTTPAMVNLTGLLISSLGQRRGRPTAFSSAAKARWNSYTALM
jgi:hypothetical protein